MPAKGRRIASRQAQLGRRRRQQSRKTEESVAVSVAAPAAIPAETAAPANAAANPAAAAPAASAAGQTRATRRPAAGQNRPDRAAAYTHLGSEMRRILILAGILLAVLVGLSFVI